jgi:uncharacterized protein GlcG (DUF336 family)
LPQLFTGKLPKRWANFIKRGPTAINMYPGKIYLVGGGVPLALDGVLVGGVGVAGLPQGVDEKSAQAGIDAWMKFRATMKR